MEKAKFNLFNPISREDWMSKIVKEYKGKKTISDFYQQNSPLVWSPFHHPADTNYHFEIKPFPNTYNTGIIYSNKMKINQVTKSLESGISFLYFDSTAAWNAELANEIRWDFIQTIIIDNHSFSEELIRYTDQKGLDIKNNYILTAADKILHIRIADYEAGSAKIESLKSSIDQEKDLALVYFELSDKFLFNIGFIRALIKYFSKHNPDLKKIAACTAHPKNEEAVLISETTQMISARLAGVSNILLSVNSFNLTDQHKLMIQNMLDFESAMTFDSDPVTGSQYLDHISHQLYAFLNK